MRWYLDTEERDVQVCASSLYARVFTSLGAFYSRVQITVAMEFLQNVRCRKCCKGGTALCYVKMPCSSSDCMK